MFDNDATDLVALIQDKGFVASTIQFAKDKLQAAYDLGVQSVSAPEAPAEPVDGDTVSDASTTAPKAKRASKTA